MCKDVSNVVSSSEGSGGRHPGESAPLESPGSGEMGGNESDGEGGSVEGGVGDDDGRVGGRAGGCTTLRGIGENSSQGLCAAGAFRGEAQ